MSQKTALIFRDCDGIPNRVETIREAIPGEVYHVAPHHLAMPGAVPVEIPYDGPDIEGIFPAHEARANALNEMRIKRGLAPVANIGAKKRITLNAFGVFEMVPEPPVEFPVDPENPEP